jgi:hypothetical protein
MQNTTPPTVVALESITPEILFHVSGGCHKSAPPAPPAPAPAPITQVVQMPVLQMAAPQPQFAPPPESRGPEVSTSVSINGQPA